MDSTLTSPAIGKSNAPRTLTATVGWVALSLILFLLLGKLGTALTLRLLPLMAALPGIGMRGLTVLSSLTASLFSALSLLLPTWLLYRLQPAPSRLPLPLKPVLPPYTAAWIPAGLALVTCAASFNSFLFKAFTTGTESQTAGMEPWQVALSFITSVIVPAFLEELLFRGAVLTVLRPYGTTVAILGSALSFGLCHRSPGQILYATLAGVLFGYLCLVSGSLWCGLLIHFFNNLFSLVQTVIDARFSGVTGTRIVAILQITLLFWGLLALCRLLGKKQFRPLPPETPIAAPHPVRAFCSPFYLAFAALCLWDVLELLLLWFRALFSH